MVYKDLVKEYRIILELVSGRRIAEAFEALTKLTDKCRNIDFRNRLNKNIETYKNILRYSFELGDDPEKDKVYFRLVKALLELTDDVKEELIIQFNFLAYYRLHRKPDWQTDQSEAEAAAWIDQVSLESEVEKLLNSDYESESEKQSTDTDKNSLHKLFTSLWLTDKLNDNQISLVKKVCDYNHLPWYYKSVLVSGLTLSVLRHFDVEKLNLLFEFYQQNEHQVWQRALIGILISLFVNDQRIHLYPEILQRIKAFQSDKKWNKTIEAIVIQFLRARETEKIAEKIKEDFMPEIMKMRTKLEEKLNLEELLSEKLLEDKNPDWETVFEDTPELYTKMEEFSNLQMEGSDVFMSAFAMLKRFDFFNEAANWFLPFYKENDLFESSFDDVKEGFDSSSFLEGLEKTRFLCNSDKYSFCLNVKHMPSIQKSMMVELFNMELNAMNEMASDDEIIHTEMRNRSIIIQYIQDLYRFFRLHPWNKEFDDIFGLKLDFHNKAFFTILVDNPQIIRNIGEFYFEKDHFQEALEVYLSLEKHESGHELLEKTAYCYQHLGRFEDALVYYKKSELLSEPRSWLLNKIAYSYRKLGDTDEAIKHYLDSEKIEPENLYIQSSLGQVYMDNEDYEQALKYFFKVEYLAPDNIKVHRPIAWCSFVLGKHETAMKYFEKVISKEGNQNDYMNLGHVNWVMGDKQNAIENYRLSLKKADNDHLWFGLEMEEDKSHLLRFEIPEFDITLMLDYLRMNPEV
ncbi:MAG: tetratricopeptide repeat protein [Bacteroidales bacterium]|nr:tetratricopeptide repeat protein [Bacteroidales bacterium]